MSKTNSTAATKPLTGKALRKLQALCSHPKASRLWCPGGEVCSLCETILPA